MKKLCLLLIAGILILCMACSQSALQTIGNEINDSANNLIDSDNKYVQMVKNGHREDKPDLSYDTAFADFFGTPRWHYFKADSGENVVEFTGDCMYQKVSVRALIQFTLDEENGTFEATYLSFNDVPQNMLTMIALFSAVFGEDSEEENQYESDLYYEDSYDEDYEDAEYYSETVSKNSFCDNPNCAELRKQYDYLPDEFFEKPHTHAEDGWYLFWCDICGDYVGEHGHEEEDSEDEYYDDKDISNICPICDTPIQFCGGHIE